ncbi:hypothetical protein K490DRAFT_60745, partial [Saccharata proteae CBS 121410]
RLRAGGLLFSNNNNNGQLKPDHRQLTTNAASLAAIVVIYSLSILALSCGSDETVTDSPVEGNESPVETLHEEEFQVVRPSARSLIRDSPNPTDPAPPTPPEFKNPNLEERLSADNAALGALPASTAPPAPPGRRGRMRKVTELDPPSRITLQTIGLEQQLLREHGFSELAIKGATEELDNRWKLMEHWVDQDQKQAPARKQEYDRQVRDEIKAQAAHLPTIHESDLPRLKADPQSFGFVPPPFGQHPALVEEPPMIGVEYHQATREAKIRQTWKQPDENHPSFREDKRSDDQEQSVKDDPAFGEAKLPKDEELSIEANPFFRNNKLSKGGEHSDKEDWSVRAANRSVGETSAGGNVFETDESIDFDMSAKTHPPTPLTGAQTREQSPTESDLIAQLPTSSQVPHSKPIPINRPGDPDKLPEEGGQVPHFRTPERDIDTAPVMRPREFGLRDMLPMACCKTDGWVCNDCKHIRCDTCGSVCRQPWCHIQGCMNCAINKGSTRCRKHLARDDVIENKRASCPSQ